MSYYLCFKKGDVSICNFCRITNLYQAFDDIAPWGKWEPITYKDLNDGVNFAKIQITFSKEEINKLEMILVGLHSYEERYNVVNNIKEAQKQIEQWEKVIIQIEMLMNIFGGAEEDGKTLVPLEWGIF